MKKVLTDSLIREYGSVTDNDPSSLRSREDKLKHAVINLRMTLIDGIPSPIDDIPYLFLGSIGSAYNFKELQHVGITHILCLSSEIHLKYPNGFSYKRVNMIDKPEHDISIDFFECFEFILCAKEAGGKCLVHCYQGKSRSAAIVCAYLIKYYGCTFQSAMDKIRKNRETVSPNSGFIRALRKLESEKLTS